jgi:uncharacterized protein YjbI with pentapeptide repeats
LDVLRRVQDRVPEEYRTSLDLRETNLQGANLQGANLLETNLRGAFHHYADLHYADLQGANLQGVNFIGAILRGANLQRANVSTHRLADTLTLRGATMPNGEKYEDWLKDREQRGKDGENE